MLETLAVTLLLSWVLGIATSYTMDGYIFVLLPTALLVMLLRLSSGRRVNTRLSDLLRNRNRA